MWYSPTGTLGSLLKMTLITNTKLQHRYMWQCWSCSAAGYRPCPSSLFTLLDPVCDPVLWQFLWQTWIFFWSNSLSLTGLQGQRHHHTIGASGRECWLQCNGVDSGYTTSWTQRSRPEKQVCIQIEPEFTDTSMQDHPAQMDFWRFWWFKTVGNTNLLTLIVIVLLQVQIATSCVQKKFRGPREC
jgi:hypothetical protein